MLVQYETRRDSVNLVLTAVEVAEKVSEEMRKLAGVLKEARGKC